jgi:hypothetical protein
MGYTGLRWGELVGLQTDYVRNNQLRVEWQLYEMDTGKLLRCPPKDESRRTIDLPDWLAELLQTHVRTTTPAPCACHGHRYVFRGLAAANGVNRQQGTKITDVARRAGVSTGTVSNVLNRPDTVAEGTRVKVTAAIQELGFLRGGSPACSRPTGAAAASPPGCSNPPPPAATLAEAPAEPIPCRSWPTPGRASPSAAATPPAGPKLAGCRSRRV